MGCGSSSKTSPEEDEGLQDIEMSRSCTDCLWIPIFGMFWIGMLAIAIVGFSMGKPNKLIYAVRFSFEILSRSDGLQGVFSVAVLLSYALLIFSWMFFLFFGMLVSFCFRVHF
jgi:hypothetical protein|tara:strand:+ start:157 stop:495 length:339 start_codon:yes stop_codon:yes gene_type:complete